MAGGEAADAAAAGTAEEGRAEAGTPEADVTIAVGSGVARGDRAVATIIFLAGVEERRRFFDVDSSSHCSAATQSCSGTNGMRS